MLFPAGSRLTGAGLTAATLLGVIKGSGESVTSSTTLQNDNALVLPVAANTEYRFECFISFTGALTGGNLQTNWTAPAGSNLEYTASGLDESNNPILGVSFTLSSSNIGWGTNGTSSLRGGLMTGTLVTSGTAGNLQLQWTQGTSNSTPTTVRAASFLGLTQVLS